MQNLYLGIDPGRSKTGLALVAQDGTIEKLHIAMTDDFAHELEQFVADCDIRAIIMGDGTNSKVLAEVTNEVLPALELHFVREAHSTEDARKLYWQVNPPTGLKRLIPLGLQVPPEPLDAYAAVIQVRRWLKEESK